LILQGERGLEKINLDNVYYIEQGENNSLIYLADEEIITSKLLDECEKLFPPDKFVRTCESYIVNLDKIFIIKFPEIIISDKMTVIPVDEDKRALVESKLKN
jgi:DNA-binding LytR/AlgR family response regulator